MEILFALMHNLNLAYVELNEVGSWLSFPVGLQWSLQWCVCEVNTSTELNFEAATLEGCKEDFRPDNHQCDHL